MVAILKKPRGATPLEIVVHRSRRCVEIFNVVMHGHRPYRCLIYTTDARMSLATMQPPTKARHTPWPRWARHEAGSLARTPTAASSVIKRTAAVAANLSLQVETFIPARLLRGMLPEALMDDYFFWQCEDGNLRGYPKPALRDATTFLSVLLRRGGHVATDGLHDSTATQISPAARVTVVRRNLQYEQRVRDATLVAADQVRELLDRKVPLPSSGHLLNRNHLDSLKSLLLDLGRPAVSGQTWEDCRSLAAFEDLLIAVDLPKGSESGPKVSEVIKSIAAAHKSEQAAQMEVENGCPTTSGAQCEEAAVLLDLRHAAASSPLHSITSTFTRIENLSHILCWAKYEAGVDYTDPNALAENAAWLVVLPRLKLTFNVGRALRSACITASLHPLLPLDSRCSSHLPQGQPRIRCITGARSGW